MKALGWLSASVAVAALAAPASAQYQYFENFESGIGGWSLWTERGTNGSAVLGLESLATLGDIQPFSGGNNAFAFVGGNGFNGGIYQVINLPLGAGTYTIDGFWRSVNVQPQNAWAEVIVVEGSNAPTNGSDLTGPLLYKNDTFGGGPAWDGLISSFPQQGGALGGQFTTASGTITVVLKSGNGTGESGTVFDDIHITPEPASAAILALGAIPMLLRRRRMA